MSKIRIAIDINGGDYAPMEIIEGVKIALENDNNIYLSLFGDELLLKKEIKDRENVEIINAPLAVSMGEKDPIGFLRTNRNNNLYSLIGVLNYVKEKSADAIVTAGPTQIVVTAAHFINRRITNMERMALCLALPSIDGKNRYMLDVGANVELKGEHLEQFAMFSTIYLREVLKISYPRVGLLNIGEEPGKGREEDKATYDLLKNNKNIDFIGNIEPTKLFKTDADILVTDGYTGNMVMKTAEGVASSIGSYLKKEVKGCFRKFGYIFMRKVFKNLKKKMSSDEVGGAILFGANDVIIKAHGSSSRYAIASAIIQAKKTVETKVIEQMKEVLNESNNSKDN